MKTKEEAKKFLDQVSVHAESNTRSGVAKILKMTASQFNTSLLSALIITESKPPKFAITGKNGKPTKSIITVQENKKTGVKFVKFGGSFIEKAGWKGGEILQIKASLGKIIIKSSTKEMKEQEGVDQTKK